MRQVADVRAKHEQTISAPAQTSQNVQLARILLEWHNSHPTKIAPGTRVTRAHRVQGCKSRALGKDPQSLICQATVACRIASLSDTHECIDTFPEPSWNGCPARIVLEIICKSKWYFAFLVWHGLTLYEWTYDVWCVCVCDSWKEYKSFAIANFKCVCVCVWPGLPMSISNLNHHSSILNEVQCPSNVASSQRNSPAARW